jgi:molybdate transport system substrate-binding protein
MPLPGLAAEIFIAAASDLIYCVDELNAGFVAENADARLRTTTGSSGNFAAQIRHGAPFDIFLSADQHYPQALIDSGDAVAGTLTPYAVGRLAIWTRRNDLDLSKGLLLLSSPQVRTYAIANPEHAPYGRAARAALEQANLWHALAAKRVTSENIAQALQFVQTGNADVGIVALSLVVTPALAGQGRYAILPSSSHPRLDQAAVLTHRARNNPLALRYLQWLRSATARSILDRNGFQLPAAGP